MGDPLEDDVLRYEMGRKWRAIYHSPAWELLLDTLKSYVDDADYQVRKLPPGDPSVIAAHAALSALNDMVEKFELDIKSWVEFADNPSPEFVEYITGVRNSSDVLKAMNQ